MKILKLSLALIAMIVSTPSLAAEKQGKLPDGYITIDTMVVPVLDDYRLQGKLTAKFTIFASDRAARDRYSQDMPKAVDIYMRRLTDFARLWVDPSRPVDVERLAGALQAATDEFVPNSGSKVYILEATVRRQ